MEVSLYPLQGLALKANHKLTCLRQSHLKFEVFGQVWVGWLD